MTENNMIAPDPRLLEKLVCPVTKQNIFYDTERHLIISPTAQLGFPIKNGIPIMLPEEAISLSSPSSQESP